MAATSRVGSILLALSLATTPLDLNAQSAPASDVTVTNRFHSSAGKWMKVSNADCTVWNSFPRDGESATWSGGIRNGKAHGKGTLQWFVEGRETTQYVGEMKEGLADGRGIAKGSDAEFEGDWSQGSLISTNGTIKYPDGNWYRGQLKNGFKNGHGEELLKGGQKYVGEFRNDRFHGKGELFLSNGDKISGEWKNSKLEGVGTYYPKEGEPIRVKQTESGIHPL